MVPRHSALAPVSEVTMARSAIQPTFDFGSLLEEILAHVTRRRGFHRPIHLAAIDQDDQMMLWTLKDDPMGGVLVHYPPMAGTSELPYLELSLSTPLHLLLVDRDGKAIKATIMATGQWLLG
jgi:hypothetical protein